MSEPAKTVQKYTPLRVLKAQERVKGAVYYLLSDGVDIPIFDQPRSMGDKRWNDYAPRIVSAFNSHQTLVDALKNAQRHLITLGGDPRATVRADGSIDGDEIQAMVLDQIDAALASTGAK